MPRLRILPHPDLCPEGITLESAPGTRLSDALLAAEPFVGTDCFVLVGGACPDGALDALAAETGRICWMAAVERDTDDAPVLQLARKENVVALMDAPLLVQRYAHQGRLWRDAGVYRFAPDIFDACRCLPVLPDGCRGELRGAIVRMLATGECRFRALLCPPPAAK